MTVEIFVDRFDRFAEAPNGVAKLRELILQLAVQGRLVEQLEDDGTAEELLATLARAGLVGVDALNYEPRDPPLPSLPHNWLWAPTSMLCDLQTGKRMKGGAQDSGVISLGGEHIRPDGTVNYAVPRYVSREFYDDMQSGKVAASDTVMVKDGATTGKVAFVAHLPPDGRAAVNEHVFILRWHAPIEKRLAYYFIRAFAPSHIATKSAGLIGGIRREAVLGFPFPLPPLAEQRRLVAKVDELMALCDRLDALQRDRRALDSELGHASLVRFAESPTRANLDFLFHPAYAISPPELRKVILTLAVQGKLVPQDPCDEPVEDLLARCLVDRRVLQRGSVSLCPPSDAAASMGYEIPATWRWQALADILVFGPTNGFSPKAVDYETSVRSLTLSATTSGRFKGEHSKYIEAEVPPQSELWLRDGDVLVQRGNTIEYVGVSAVYRGAPNQFVYPDLMMKCRVAAAIDVEFIHLAMSHEAARNYLRARASGTSGSMPKINQPTLKSLPVPIPPIGEQRRIVAKVGELMGMVDQLEANLRASEAIAERLTGAVVDVVIGRE